MCSSWTTSCVSIPSLNSLPQTTAIQTIQWMQILTSRMEDCYISCYCQNFNLHVSNASQFVLLTKASVYGENSVFSFSGRNSALFKTLFSQTRVSSAFWMAWLPLLIQSTMISFGNTNSYRENKQQLIIIDKMKNKHDCQLSNYHLTFNLEIGSLSVFFDFIFLSKSKRGIIAVNCAVELRDREDRHLPPYFGHLQLI